MGIRSVFSTPWKNAVAATALNPNVEIFPEQRVIIKRAAIGPFEIGELAFVYQTGDLPDMLSVRFTSKAMFLPSLLHTLEQRGRIKRAGINVRTFYENGVVQCNYWLEGYLREL